MSQVDDLQHAGTFGPAGEPSLRWVGPAAPFYVPTGFTLIEPHATEPLLRRQDQSGMAEHAALSYQAMALARFLGEGRTESLVLGLDESVSVLALVHAPRAQFTPTGG